MSKVEQCKAEDSKGRRCALEAGGHTIHDPERPGNRARTTLSDLRYTRKALNAIAALTHEHEHESQDPEGWQATLLEVRQLALTALEETEEPTVPFRRAGGGSVCPSCLSRYREHPLDRRPEATSDAGKPWLRVLCNGERVKL